MTDWVNFLPRGSYDVMFGIFDENSYGHTPTTVVVVAVQCLCRAIDISAPRTTQPGRSRGSTGSWEATEPGQLILSGQRDVLCHGLSCSAIKAGVRGEKGVINLCYVALCGTKTIIRRRKWCELFFER